MHAVFAICLGACVGALARWRLGLWLNHPGAFMPWGTLAAMKSLGRRAQGERLERMRGSPRLPSMLSIIADSSPQM